MADVVEWFGIDAPPNPIGKLAADADDDECLLFV